MTFLRNDNTNSSSDQTNGSSWTNTHPKPSHQVDEENGTQNRDLSVRRLYQIAQRTYQKYNVPVNMVSPYRIAEVAATYHP